MALPDSPQGIVALASVTTSLSAQRCQSQEATLPLLPGGSSIGEPPRATRQERSRLGARASTDT